MGRIHRGLTATIVSMTLIATLAVALPAPAGAAGPPPAPRVESLVRANGAVEVALSAIPGSNVRYQARCVRQGVTRTSAITTIPRMTVSGLTNGVKWSCSGRAKRSGTWSEWSSARPMTPSTLLPARPGRPAVARLITGAGQALITVKPPRDDGGATVQAYQARCVRDGQVRLSDVESDRQVVVLGLVVNTEWSCSTRVWNIVGPSRWSDTDRARIRAANVSAGPLFTCAVKPDTTVGCTGSNNVGQVGDGTMIGRLSLTSVIGVRGARAIASGGGHACALIVGGYVKCWGYNSSGQLGDGTTTTRLTAIRVPGLTGVISLSAGAGHTCAVTTNRTAYCWGSNYYGELGDNSTVDRGVPTRVVGLNDVVEISAGVGHTCVVRATGAVYCWGRNSDGQLGDGTIANRTSPTAVVGITDATSVSAGYEHTCAIVGLGDVTCWGDNMVGELGNGTQIDSLTPVPVAGIARATSIDLGSDHTCVIEEGAALQCWGSNGLGQLGNGAVGGLRTTPGFVSGGLEATGVSMALYHSCASTSSGGVSCWGWNGEGQMGTGNTDPSVVPTPMLGIP